MSEQTVFEIFKNLGVVVTDSHIVYTSGKHGPSYIDKDMVYPSVQTTSILCQRIARKFSTVGVEVVVGPEKGGIILSQWVAYHLSVMTGQRVFAFYAEKTGQGGFFLKRGRAEERISGKRILMVEDILNTGGSVKKVIEEIRRIGGIVVGLGVLCNRGGVIPEEVANPPELFALVNADLIEKEVDLTTWDAKDCELCKQHVPINTIIGKGKEFLARRDTK